MGTVHVVVSYTSRIAHVGPRGYLRANKTFDVIDWNILSGYSQLLPQIFGPKGLRRSWRTRRKLSRKVRATNSLRVWNAIRGWFSVLERVWVTSDRFQLQTLWETSLFSVGLWSFRAWVKGQTTFCITFRLSLFRPEDFLCGLKLSFQPKLAFTLRLPESQDRLAALYVRECFKWFGRVLPIVRLVFISHTDSVRAALAGAARVRYLCMISVCSGRESWSLVLGFVLEFKSKHFCTKKRLKIYRKFKCFIST